MNINEKFGLEQTVDVDRLITTLNNSKIATKNNPLHQTVFGIIKALSRVETNTKKSINTITQSNGTSSTSGGGSVTPGSGITELVGEVLAGPGTGTVPATLSTTGVVAGTYGDATNIAQITVDSRGRITVITDIPITYPTEPDDYVVMSDGGIPTPLPVDDGAGNFIYIPYVP